MNLYFTKEQQREFLEKRGFEFQLTKFTMCHSVYHNDIEKEDVEIHAIIRNGEFYKKPSGNCFTEMEWLENVFYEQLREALLQL